MSINQYVNLFNETTEEESERLKKLPYEDFLKTDYWHIIANHVKQRDGFRCTKCGKLPKFREFLNVHHLTYENHGYEHQTHQKDLVTLCRECHIEIHDPKTKVSKQKRIVKIIPKTLTMTPALWAICKKLNIQPNSRALLTENTSRVPPEPRKKRRRRRRRHH